MDIVSVGRPSSRAIPPHKDADGPHDGASRVAWVDTAKGICIILVVMMHATLGVGEAMGGEGFVHWIVAFARPFRMPDFFLVSGLFLGRVIDRDWRSYADRRVVHFLYFYLLWLGIQSLLKYGQISNGGPLGLLGHLAFALVEPYSTLWFIYILAAFSVATKLARRAPSALLLAGAALLEIAPIETPWIIFNEFCERWIYFLAGYLFAPSIFRLADRASNAPGRAWPILGAWAAANGGFALTPSPWASFPTLASLPVLSLALGLAGAVAIVTLAAILSRSRLCVPFRYCGEHSIAIYLAFFLPMAASRTALVELGLVPDVGLMSLIVTTFAVLVPLVLERLARGTRADFLFRRPAWAHIAAPKRVRLQPAEEISNRSSFVPGRESRQAGAHERDRLPDRRTRLHLG